MATKRLRFFLLLLLVVEIVCYARFRSMVSSSRLGSKSSRKHKTSPSQLNAIAYATESNRTIANIIDNANDADTASEEEETPVNVLLVSKAQFPEWKKGVANESVDLLQTLTGVNVNNFPGTRIVNVPNDKTVTQVAFYDEKAVAKKSFRVFDGYWSQLKNKTYALSAFAGAEIEAEVANKLALSFALSTYRMNYFKKGGKAPSNTKLIWPSTCDKGYVRNVARAYTLMKDLSDTPAMDCGPAELGDAAVAIGNELGASKIEVTVGVDNLIKNNYSQIAAVGMAASSGREPRIVDIEWNSGTDTASADESTPQIVIVGKGVTFDTGGLNIKGGGGMRSMKRDMSGAAQALAFAQLVVSMKLPVRVRLLLPIAENSISGCALRPGDVIRARNGKTTEITNTDAEGRLILADALVAACESEPAMIVDFATLTGAARVALGGDLPAVWSNNQDKLESLWKLSYELDDPLWMMPLHEPMRGSIKSSIADFVNAAEGFGGAIKAALYLSEFIEAKKVKSASAAAGSDVGEASVDDSNDTSDAGSPAEKDEEDEKDEKDGSDSKKMLWFHIDFMAASGGVPEPQAMLTMYEFVKKEYCTP